MKYKMTTAILAAAVSLTATAKDLNQTTYGAATQATLDAQRAALKKNTEGKGYGPQAPRDIDALSGANTRAFEAAPASAEMSLCNIHFHAGAEHKGGEFTSFAGYGNGHGYGTGYKYSGELTAAEKTPVEGGVCPSKYGKLQSGDTIEVHYVHSTAKVQPGPTLGSCLSEAIKNPQLRVETQVYVLVNDKNAGDFVELAKVGTKNGLPQPLNIPTDTGAPVQYAGSTTGPGYNEKGSPFQVTWSVRPKVAKVDVSSVGEWCKGNVFNEDHAHGVRNLVTNPSLLSRIN